MCVVIAREVYLYTFIVYMFAAAYGGAVMQASQHRLLRNTRYIMAKLYTEAQKTA